MTPNTTTDTPVVAEFDIREFARTAHGSMRSQLDLAEVVAGGLPSDAVRLVRILRALERSTLERLRNLLVTATHKDARVTAFLVTWAYEKFWLADALDAVLDAAGEADEPQPAPARKRFRERFERRGPVARAIRSNFDGPQIVAAHVTTGLVDEWISQAAYRRLGELAQALGAFVDQVVAIKDRHVHFLAEEAQRRLAATERARRLTRAAILQAVWPIGAGHRSDDDRRFFATTVFGSAEGQAQAAHISELLGALPGIAPVAPTVAARLVP